MNKSLLDYLDGRMSEFDQIPDERKALLQELSQYIGRNLQERGEVHLNFLCTHNSRRSQLSQVWAHVASEFFGLNVHAYSGGTEVTAFNERAVKAVQNAGLGVDIEANGDNPKYVLSLGQALAPFHAYSKTYDDAVPEGIAYAAVMTCSHADQNCPFIPEADWRFPLRYDDPKAFDDTPQEAEKYAERCAQIARELLYAFKNVKK